DCLRKWCCKCPCLLRADTRVRLQFHLPRPKPIVNEGQKRWSGATPPIPLHWFFEAPSASTRRALSHCCTNAIAYQTKASSHPSPELAPGREPNLSSDKLIAERVPPHRPSTQAQ